MTGQRSYRYIFFDWDGCLADTLQSWLDGYRAALGKRGLYPTDAVIVRELFNDWAGPERFGVPDAPRFIEEMAAHLERNLAAVRPNPHVPEVLRELKSRGKTTALLTASRRRLVEPVLEASGLVDSLDLLLTVEDVRRHKPHPEVIEKALALLAADREEALIVGDSDKDIQTGRNSEITTVLYFPESNRRFYDLDLLKSCEPDYVIGDFRDLLPIVDP